MEINDLINNVVDGDSVESVINSIFEESTDVDEARFTSGGKTTSREGNNAILSIAVPEVKKLLASLGKKPNVGLSDRYGGPNSEALLKEAKTLDGSLKRLKTKLEKFMKKLEASRQ